MTVAMVSKIAWMAVMKTLLLAKTSVIYLLFHTTAAIIAVALGWKWLAVPRTSPCVRMAAIWTSPSVRASAIHCSHTLRTHIDGLAQRALRNVFSTHLDAMVILIVTMAQTSAIPAMNAIVHWSLG